MCFNINIDKDIFITRKLQNEYPYIIYFHKLDKDNNKFKEQIIKYYKNDNINFTKKEYYELLIKLSTENKDIEYYSYLIN